MAQGGESVWSHMATAPPSGGGPSGSYRRGSRCRTIAAAAEIRGPAAPSTKDSEAQIQP